MPKQTLALLGSPLCLSILYGQALWLLLDQIAHRRAARKHVSPQYGGEEGGREAHSKSERTSNWGPWPPISVSGKQVQSAQQYGMQSASRGSNPWARLGSRSQKLSA